jgi:hypothetical protein
VILGHSRADVTQVYAERDQGLAAEVVAKIGQGTVDATPSPGGLVDRAARHKSVCQARKCPASTAIVDLGNCGKVT